MPELYMFIFLTDVFRLKRCPRQLFANWSLFFSFRLCVLCGLQALWPAASPWVYIGLCEHFRRFSIVIHRFSFLFQSFSQVILIFFFLYVPISCSAVCDLLWPSVASRPVSMCVACGIVALCHPLHRHPAGSCSRVSGAVVCGPS